MNASWIQILPERRNTYTAPLSAAVLAERRVTRGRQQVHLTPTEFRLLAALAEQPSHTLSPKELLFRVWGSEYADDVDNVKRYIHYLRQKLEADVEHPRLILTARGFGYYLA